MDERAEYETDDTNPVQLHADRRAGYFPPDMDPDRRAAFPDDLKGSCARCGYDLTALPEDAPVCPECGTPMENAWGEGRASTLSIIAVVISGISLMSIGCTGGFGAVIALPGLALGVWARSRALKGLDTPISAPMAMGAIIMSGVILAIAGFILASFILISLI